MKKQLLFATLLMSASLTSWCQEEDTATKSSSNYGTHNNFRVDLGINNYLQKDGKFSDENNATYTVKPLGSWYIALKSVNDTHVSGPLHALWGIDVSWYNFKFQNESIRLSKENNELTFKEDLREVEALKSKLTAVYVNASFVPMLKLGNNPKHYHKRPHWCKGRDHDGFRIGAGGYGGYKIASYAKYVTEENGDKNKDKDKDSFYLNNLRYGMRIQAGFRGVDIFMNYDLNELFVDNRGPELNAFSFGVIL